MKMMIVLKGGICVADQDQGIVFQSHGCVMEKMIVVGGRMKQHQYVVRSKLICSKLIYTYN